MQRHRRRDSRTWGIPATHPLRAAYPLPASYRNRYLNWTKVTNILMLCVTNVGFSATRTRAPTCGDEMFFCILSVLIAILTFYFLSNFPLACSVDRTTSATNGCTPKVLGPLWRLHAAQRFSAEPIGVQPLLVLGLAVGCRFKSAKMKLSS